MENRLKYWRLLRRLSLEKLAEKVGVTRATVQKLEKGTMAMKPHYMQLFADALDIDWVELFQEVSPAEKKAKKIVKELNETEQARFIGFGEGQLAQKNASKKTATTRLGSLSKEYRRESTDEEYPS